mgnify:CR=1 FL=1
MENKALEICICPKQRWHAKISLKNFLQNWYRTSFQAVQHSKKGENVFITNKMVFWKHPAFRFHFKSMEISLWGRSVHPKIPYPEENPVKKPRQRVLMERKRDRSSRSPPTCQLYTSLRPNAALSWLNTDHMEYTENTVIILWQEKQVRLRLPRAPLQHQA